MILSSAQDIERYTGTGLWGHLSLDELFFLAAQQHPDRIAFIDPPDRRKFTDGDPRQLTFAQAADAVEALTRHFVALGLEADDVVAVQLGNMVDSYLALLAIMRAHLIACPITPLWREFELAQALPQVAPRAIITASRIGGHAHADMMRFVASGLMSVRHVMTTGRDVPDGVMGIDNPLAGATLVPGVALPERRRSSANHIATICFEGGSGKAPRPVARSHNQWIAAGLAHISASGLDHGETILNPYFPVGLTALAGAFVPAILSASTLALHHPFDLSALAQSLHATGAAYTMVPPAALSALLGSGQLEDPGASLRRIGCVRSPGMTRSAAYGGESRRGGIEIVDIHNFGETATYAARRGNACQPGRIPLGAIAVAPEADAPTVLETRIQGGMQKAGGGEGVLTGTLRLRGPMVPAYRIGAGVERSASAQEAASDPENGGFVDFPARVRICRTDPAQLELLPDGADSESIHVGQCAVSAVELEKILAEHAGVADAAVCAHPDPIVGSRLAAAIVGKHGAVSDEDIRNFLRARKLAGHKIPDLVLSVASIPRDSEGLVQRAELAALL